MLLGDTVTKVCASPRNLTHQIVSPRETVGSRLGSGDETNPNGWRLKHLQGKFRSSEVGDIVA